MEGSAMNEDTVRRLFDGVDGAFVNLDGFAMGEKREVFWGIRIFELALTHGVKHCESMDFSCASSVAFWVAHAGRSEKSTSRLGWWGGLMMMLMTLVMIELLTRVASLSPLLAWCVRAAVVWGNLDYVSRKIDFDPAVRTGHYDGK
jgi:hypothetical protein